MTTPICSKCRNVIPAADVNVAADVAFCRACNLANSLSALIDGMEFEAVDVHNPVPGTWYHATGQETLIGATHRSIGGALGSLGIALFWNGIVSMFVLVALSGTLHNFGVTPPHWFPAPKMNGSSMTVGATLFLWLFLTPFIAIGTGMIWAFFSFLFGRTEVRIQQGKGSVFTGIGGLGWRRHFAAVDVREVSITEDWVSNGGTKTLVVVVLNEDRKIEFGSMISQGRKKFVAAAARQALLGAGRF